MFANAPIKALLTIMFLSSSINAAPAGLSLTQQLSLADIAADRYALLPKNTDFVYDFNTAPPGLPNRKTFPALVGTGVSIVTATIPPCGVIPIHIHPRASELFLVTSGTVQTTLIPEVGAGPIPANATTRVITNTLTTNQMTIFPQGGFHTQINPTCDSATAAAAFSSDDEGFVGIAPSLFALDDKVLEDIFGGSLSVQQIDAVRKATNQGLAIMQDCKKACGL